MEAEVLRSALAQGHEYQVTQEGFEVQIARHPARDDEWLHGRLGDQV